ncbi:acyl carrier protein, partial [Mucilaginibacter sp. SG538B]|uniref:phosphopantetheine-binding protein n=1 Tax=Mucilaginibacter sp. SG538B TaxID=2587021 RepID=UPI00159D1531
NSTEAQLAGIWKKVLDIHTVGVHDNFFELGGHSIALMRIIPLIYLEFNIKVSVRTLFELNTIEAIARFITINQNYEPAELADFEEIKL